MDDKTDYRWIVDDVALPVINANGSQTFWLIDSVRKKRQVEHFRNAFGVAVLHVHFTAPEAVLQERYDRRVALGKEYDGDTSYALAKDAFNEISARDLDETADLILDLAESSPEEAVATILKQWRRGRHASGHTD